MKFNKLVICGKGGSGKDHLRKILAEQGFKYSVSVTSRPMRADEKDGLDYNFISLEQANRLVEEGLLYEHCTFNGWVYGTTKDQFQKSNLFILTPRGISQIKKEDRENTIIVYLDISENIRRERLSKRRDADDVERRIKADDSDFKNFEDFDLIINNPDFDLESISYLTKIIKK